MRFSKQVKQGLADAEIGSSPQINREMTVAMDGSNKNIKVVMNHLIFEGICFPWCYKVYAYLSLTFFFESKVLLLIFD